MPCLLHRQADLRLGGRAFHLPDRRDLDSAAAGRAISDHRAALDLDLDQLSRRVAGKPLQQRHAADRGGAQRRPRHPQFRIHLRIRSGRSKSTANFVPGTDTGAASVEVQNRLKRVEARLPRAVIQQGILVEEASSAVLQIITLTLDRRLARRNRPRRFHDPQRARRDPAHSRRRPRHALLHRTLDADLDRSRQSSSATASPPTTSTRRSRHRTRRSPRAASAPSRARRNSRFPPLVLVKGQLASPEQFGAIVLRANRGRLDRAAARRRAHRDRRPELPVHHAAQRQADRRPRRCCSRRPATRWPPPAPSKPRWRNCRSSSRPASSTTSPTTSRPSSRPRSTRC